MSWRLMAYDYVIKDRKEKEDQNNSEETEEEQLSPGPSQIPQKTKDRVPDPKAPKIEDECNE